LNTLDNLEVDAVDNLHVLIGKNVKRIRKSRNVTQLQLSYALGFKSVGLVSQAEIYLNKQHFNLKHLCHIAFILECKIEDFFVKS
jgi:transcriptional regulator with XRE-family HTH domain